MRIRTVTGLILPQSSLTLARSRQPWRRVLHWAACAGFALATAGGAAAASGPGIINTVAGGGTVFGDNGPATAALIQPIDVALDPAGNLYIADAADLVVRRVDRATGVITTFAGMRGVADFSGDGGPATAAALGASGPTTIAIDGAGNLYLADQANNRIRKVSTAGIITTVAGSMDFGYVMGDGGPATSAWLTFPQALAVDAAGNLYFSDGGGLVVRKVSAATGIITTIAGQTHDLGGYRLPVGGYGGDGGPATSALLNSVLRLAVDASGNVYMIDVWGTSSPPQTIARVRRIDAATGIITTIAGGGSGDGTSGLATDADLSIGNDATRTAPGGIVPDNKGNLYLGANWRVYKIVLATGQIGPFAGTGALGTVGPHGDFTGDGGPALNATFHSYIGGLALAGNGDLYLSDTGALRVRKVEGPAASLTTLVIDATTPQSVLDGLVTLSGNVVLNNVGGFAALSLPNLVSIGGDFTVTGNASLVNLSAPKLTSVGGNLSIVLNPQLASIDLRALTSVGAAVNISSNAQLAAVNLPVLGTVGGATTFSGNGSATLVSVPALTSSGAVTIVDNGSASTTLGSPTVSGNLVIGTGNGTIVNVGSPTVTGDLSVSVGNGTIVNGGAPTIKGGVVLTNNGGTVTFGASTVSGDLTVGSSGSGTVSLGNPDVGGSLTVGSGGSGTMSIGSPKVSGDLTVASSGSGAVSVGSPDVSGGLVVTSSGGGAVGVGAPPGAPGTTTISNAKVTGDLSVTSGGATTVSSSTVGGSTSATLVNGAAIMNATMPTGTFTGPVNFSVQPVAASTLPTDTTTLSATVTPEAAYRFAFAIPTLGHDATLTFTIDVAALGVDGPAFLAALASDNASLATLGDALGSTWQVFPVCAAGVQPSAGGCVTVERLDAAGNVLPPGSATVPTAVDFVGVVGHFSSWGVVLVKRDTTPPVFSGVPGAITAEASAPAGAVVTYAAPTAADAVSGPAVVSCAPPSGSPFALGTTAVNCSARDAAGNPASASFNVTVRDTVRPVISGLPGNLTLTASVPTAATWPAPSATDAVSGNVAVVCTPASGSLFPLGTTAVNCTATDAAANVATAGFTVTVQASNPPPGGGSATLCTTLGGDRLPDLDNFQFNGTAGETVRVQLAADPAGHSTPGAAALTLLGVNLLKADATALPNLVTATLPKSAAYLVTVTELPLRTGKFTGAYCVTLESSGNAWKSLVRK